MQKSRILLYTDGAYSRLTGTGGCAFIAQYQIYNEEHQVYQLKKEGYGFQTIKDTTSNRMELQAVIDGLNFLKKPCNIIVISDATYIVDTINKWLGNFVKDRSRLNHDLMVDLHKAIKYHLDVEGLWIRGHNGNYCNERVNELAQKAAGTYKGKGSSWFDFDEIFVEDAC